MFDKNEILRYLGYRGQSVAPELLAAVDECADLMEKTAKPRYAQREFETLFAPGGIRLNGTDVVLSGGDIARHLRGCTRAALFAATLGAGADELIRRAQAADITRALILDACATALIERVCDGLEREIADTAGERGLFITARFSPGYGDLPLEIQPRILAVLDAPRRIGLTCTESLILLPRKSVTAIIGMGESLCAGEKTACGDCGKRETCAYKRGENNG